MFFPTALLTHTAPPPAGPPPLGQGVPTPVHRGQQGHREKPRDPPPPRAEERHPSPHVHQRRAKADKKGG